MNMTTYEVFAIRYGTRPTTRAECYFHYGAYGEDDAPIVMDYYFWVLRAGDAAIVVDTGFGADSGARRGRRQLIDPVQALRMMGIDTSSVELVLLTHAHYDHVGNLERFERAEVILSEREYAFWTGPWGTKEVFAVSAEASEIAHLTRLRDRGRLTLVGPEYQPRPGVRMIEVGGHTPGQTILVVDTVRGEIVLASDAVHYYEELLRERPFAHVVDVAAMFAGYRTITDLSGGAADRVVAGHDPEVMWRFARCDGELAPYVARIA